MSAADDHEPVQPTHPDIGGGDQPSSSGPTRRVDAALLEFLVCPVRKTTLIYSAEDQELISPAADLAFPIQDGVPLLSESCARPLTDDDRRRHRIK